MGQGRIDAAPWIQAPASPPLVPYRGNWKREHGNRKSKSHTFQEGEWFGLMMTSWGHSQKWGSREELWEEQEEESLGKEEKREVAYGEGEESWIGRGWTK
ncbi:hypothetical protein DUI87_07038 [Hirundo rustica rustica]|uniref:Uncharacterized protein n=1 Tax=Hirundo rustica rustica TaxID=333673 RepID=A0A3M0KNQ7_HIRRU|nr:hypothetical protein DUI87_07038 [Hirundo rustica rustica]